MSATVVNTVQPYIARREDTTVSTFDACATLKATTNVKHQRIQIQTTKYMLIALCATDHSVCQPPLSAISMSATKMSKKRTTGACRMSHSVNARFLLKMLSISLHVHCSLPHCRLLGRLHIARQTTTATATRLALIRDYRRRLKQFLRHLPPSPEQASYVGRENEQSTHKEAAIEKQIAFPAPLRRTSNARTVGQRPS